MSRQAGLATRLAEFFEQNPGEWLTREAMVVKFSCSPHSLENAMKQINSDGKHIEAVTVWRWIGDAKAGGTK